jgi:hypothetical protein
VLFGQICIKFGAYLASTFKKLISELYFLVVLFESLLSNIGNKASKKEINLMLN